MVLNWGSFAIPEDICPCLETFLVVTAKESVLPSVQWVEARDAGKHPKMCKIAPNPDNIESSGPQASGLKNCPRATGMKDQLYTTTQVVLTQSVG